MFPGFSKPWRWGLEAWFKFITTDESHGCLAVNLNSGLSWRPHSKPPSMQNTHNSGCGLFALISLQLLHSCYIMISRTVSTAFSFLMSSLKTSSSFPADTHAQISLPQNLKKANYNIPISVTDSGKPPLTNNTELKIQVCSCTKYKMDCSASPSLPVSMGLIFVLLWSLYCKFFEAHTES